MEGRGGSWAVAKEQAQQTNIVEVVVVRGSRDGRSCRGWSNAKTGGGARRDLAAARESWGASRGARSGARACRKKRVSRSMKAAECKKGNEKGKGGAKRTGSPLLLCREKKEFWTADNPRAWRAGVVKTRATGLTCVSRLRPL